MSQRSQPELTPERSPVRLRRPGYPAGGPRLSPPVLGIGLLAGPALLQGQVLDVGGGPLGPLNLIAILASVAIGFIARQAWSARPRIADAAERVSTRIPDVLSPAYAGALASANINDALMEATILDLARRGAIQIEPDVEEQDDVQLRVLDPGIARSGFEVELVRLIERRARDGVIAHRDLNSLRAEWGPARRQLRAELEERGWFNPRSRQMKLPFLVTGIIGLSLAAASIIAAILTGNGWPVLGAFIVGLTSVVVLGMGSIYPETTTEGEQEAVAWRGLRTGLARARTDAHGTVDLDDVFPYIVAFNMAASYNRHLRRAAQTGYAPAWFGPETDVATWPEGWHDYWIALHTALAPTDTANTRSPGGSFFQRYVTGGRR